MRKHLLWGVLWFMTGMVVFVWLQLKVVGVLAGLYGGLYVVRYFLTQRQLRLTAEEVARYGDQLERSTPRILEMIKNNRNTKDIAQELQQEEGIPPEVTLRYIIALGKMANTATKDS